MLCRRRALEAADLSGAGAEEKDASLSPRPVRMVGRVGELPTNKHLTCRIDLKANRRWILARCSQST